MAAKKKRGPKTPWQKRVRYARAKCTERLKPCQVQNLAAADTFAAFQGKRLNCFITIKFSEFASPLPAFRKGIKSLSKWHRKWGGELTWVYVWEAVGGFHVHALAFVPTGAKQEFEAALNHAFAGHNPHIKQGTAGPSAMAYLCKGTDWATHRSLRGNSHIRVKGQGVVTWARCGLTLNLAKSARAKVGFEGKKPENNCVKTCSNDLNASAPQRPVTNGGKPATAVGSTLVVLGNTNSHAEMAASAAHATQALDGIGNMIAAPLDSCPRHGP